MYSLNIKGEAVNVFSQSSSGEFEEIIQTLSKMVSKASDVQTGYCPSRSRKFMLAILIGFTNITFLPITA